MKAINAKKIPSFGIPNINWRQILKTAGEGLAAIKEEIDGLENSIPELEARYEELKESEKYGDMPKAEIVNMIKASCAGFNSELGHDGDGCELAISTECGWTADPMVEIPDAGPVEDFTQAAKAKKAKYTTLDTYVFEEACADTLGFGECSTLCWQFGEAAAGIFFDEDSYSSLDAETSDSVFAKLEEQKQKLVDAKDAEKKLRAGEVTAR